MGDQVGRHRIWLTHDRILKCHAFRIILLKPVVCSFGCSEHFEVLGRPRCIAYRYKSRLFSLVPVEFALAPVCIGGGDRQSMSL